MSKKITDKEVKKIFGETIRKIRLDNNLSQEKLALESGMDLTSVNEIERGHRSPMLISIYKIALALKVKPSSLLEDL